uniref:Fork-head domain-containing protein n=1 Tax=Ganoderma boninense TaxID=34458 RepID=A0A5K1JV85_9APHY|nr:Fork-head domain-containing protein [Ganoderma boninense]
MPRDMNPAKHFSNPPPVSTHSYTHAGGYYGNANLPYTSVDCAPSSGANDQSAWGQYVETYLDPTSGQQYANVPTEVAYTPTSSASNSPVAPFPQTGPYSYTGLDAVGLREGTDTSLIAHANVSLSSTFGCTLPEESVPCTASPLSNLPSGCPMSRASCLGTPPSSQETFAQFTSELVPYTRRNSPAPSTAATPSIDTMRANNWKCPYCPYVQHSRRSPDLKRHIETHTRGKSVTLWVCCGVPAINARELGVPADVVRTAPIFDFEGVPMIGGCRKTFSRRDALARHLRMAKDRGQCYGDPLSMHQPGNRRGYATNPVSSWLQSNSRISTVFGILMGVGIASTSYGLYQFYNTFTLWPPEVRADLRAGIKAKNQGDFDLSERYLRRALQTAQALPLSAFSDEPHFKLSGIAVALAEVLESSNRPSEAYETYSSALAQLRASQATGKLSGKERLRAVALAHKLGEMAEVYQRGPEEAEEFLTFAVEEVLRVVKDGQVNIKVEEKGKEREEEGEVSTMLAELELPWWVNKVDVAAPLEALGRFYSQEGKPDYATTLYLQAIGMLMKPDNGKAGPTTSVEDRCRAAQIMNNLSDLTSRVNLKVAESWARQARGVIEKTRELAGSSKDAESMALCEQTLAAVLFNLGMLLEMSGKAGDARTSFQESLEQAKRIGLRSAAMEARGALRRIDRIAGVQPGDAN